MKKLLALVLTLCLALGVSLASAETFKMGIDPEYDPFSYMGNDGDYTGFDVAVCKAACELAGLEWEAVPVDWDFKLQMLDARAGRFWWFARTAELKLPRIWRARWLPFSWAPPARICWKET